MALITRSAHAPARQAEAAVRPGKALRSLDLAVLGTVWMLCVMADWSTGAKVALNLAAVAVLCLKELAVHAWAVRGTDRPARTRSGLVPVPAL